MENFLEGGVAELETVKEVMSDISANEQACKELEKSIKAKQKELEIQKKRVEEKINSTIKKSRSELEKGFNDQLGSADKVIKEAETDRKNAKAAAVNLRMQRENSTLVDENKILSAELKRTFKENKLPAFCETRLYYSLFQPKNRKDYLICGIAILIFAGLIPFIITRFVDTTFLKVLLWILLVVFFAAIYFLIYSWTRKGEKNEVLNNARNSVERIADNKKFIKKRNKNILADPDESQYNLYEYDSKVESAKEAYDAIAKEKEEALVNFEHVESVNIRQTMEEEKAPMFEELQKEIDQMEEELTAKSDVYQELSSKLGEYTEYFDDKSLKAEKIDELISVINEGKASTIQEAMELLKGGK